VAKWLEEAEHIGGQTAFCLSFQLETKPIMTLGFKRQYEEIQRSCQKKQTEKLKITQHMNVEHATAPKTG